MELLEIVKNSLGIVSTSTMKDTQLNSLIEGAKLDLIRQSIDVENLLDNNNHLVVSAIVQFVKANFDMYDIDQQRMAWDLYKLNCTNLSLSHEYIGVDGLCLTSPKKGLSIVRKTLSNGDVIMTKVYIK